MLKWVLKINYIVNIMLLDIYSFTDPNSYMKNEGRLLNIDVVLKAILNYNFYLQQSDLRLGLYLFLMTVLTFYVTSL